VKLERQCSADERKENERKANEGIKVREIALNAKFGWIKD
jgi:hypothetical protein